VIILLSCRPFRPFLDRAEKYVRLAVSLVATTLAASFCNFAPLWADQTVTSDHPATSPTPKLQFRDLHDQAARFNSVLTLPDWETTVAQVDANVDAAIRRGVASIPHGHEVANVNYLTSVEKVDKMTGMVLYTGVPIQVEPVTA